MEEDEVKPKKETISDREEAVLRFWKEQEIFEKSLKATAHGEPYIFYDGPPFATGLPHQGHLLQGTIKDIIPRYQTMRGKYVRREWGWDCHGLPIENIIEKELGLKQKEDIERYGIEKFNAKAKESVLTYEHEWKQIVPRMGRWVDMNLAYKTMDPSYTESIWWAFKKLYDKKLIYEGYKSMHICPRCETTLASSEVAQGYKDVKDISVYVLFEFTPGQTIGDWKIPEHSALLAWTTTPWTLPGNVATAVHADFEYVFLETADKKIVVVAKERLSALATDIKLSGNILKTVRGRDFAGLSYVPLFDYYAKDAKLVNRENGWKVYLADFVTLSDGTGVVHEAPAFGEVDMELGKAMNLPFIQHVGMNGKMRPEVADFAGMYVKPKSDDDKERLATDIAVLRYLETNGTFFAKQNMIHSYPHCWRCDWPLLNYAAGSWFVNVTALKPRLVETNKSIKWVPENIRDGRFGKWLEGARDWAISRSRYWGAPLPVWKCDVCAKVETLGSLDDLRAKTCSGNVYTMMRHGESETNTRGIVSYKADDPYGLTEKGKSEARATAGKLKKDGIDLIFVSPLLRTRETAVLVAKELGVVQENVIIDARLSEVNTGEFNGCPIDTYRTYFTSTLEKFEKPSPGGETLREMKLRLAEFLYETDAKYTGKKILIVTHEYGTWLLEAIMRGATDEEASLMRVLGGDDYTGFAEAKALPFAPIPHNERYELDFHRPHIDKIAYPCACGGGFMRRIPDVFDCWFESGSMPFAQFHYMGDERTPDGKMFMKNFPADFIAEAVDQTRGWFYTMHILSAALFDKPAFRSVITTGLILAEDGQKMSKKLKNYDDPMELAEKYGADALRFYMVNSPVVRGEELLFSSSGVEEVFKKMTLRIGNVLTYYETYAKGHNVPREVPRSAHVLDSWIVARMRETHAEVTHYLDTHELDRATRLIMPFVDDLSTWYLRRSRDRFHSEDGDDRRSAEETTGWVLVELAKLLAPFMPFLAEDIYQRIAVADKKESVHLENWTPVSIAPHAVLVDMEETRRVVTLALEARAKAGIKVRQPLATLTVGGAYFSGKPEFLAIIADEVNVKHVVSNEKMEGITLDTVITPVLRAEGESRDLIREVQELRKKEGLLPGDRITLLIPKEKEELYLANRSFINSVIGATAHEIASLLGVRKVSE